MQSDPKQTAIQAEMMHKLATASPVHRGYAAYRAGKTIDSCPYPWPGFQSERGSDWSKWHMGWTVAQRDGPNLESPQ